MFRLNFQLFHWFKSVLKSNRRYFDNKLYNYRYLIEGRSATLKRNSHSIYKKWPTSKYGKINHESLNYKRNYKSMSKIPKDKYYEFYEYCDSKYTLYEEVDRSIQVVYKTDWELKNYLNYVGLTVEEFLHDPDTILKDIY